MGFLKSTPVSFPILFDPDSKVSKLYEVPGMPSTVILDRTGKVRYVHQGYKPGEEEPVSGSNPNAGTGVTVSQHRLGIIAWSYPWRVCCWAAAVRRSRGSNPTSASTWPIPSCLSIPIRSRASTSTMCSKCARAPAARPAASAAAAAAIKWTWRSGSRTRTLTAALFTLAAVSRAAVLPDDRADLTVA